jgi:YD repeat-containing protein
VTADLRKDLLAIVLEDRGRKVQSSTTTGNTTKFYDDRGRTTGTTTATGRK